jgi:flagellar hook assembly protein FlgD
LPEAGHLRVSIYGATGRRVALLGDRVFRSGLHEIIWTGRDDGGRSVPPGIYFVQIEGLGIRDFSRIVLLESH